MNVRTSSQTPPPPVCSPRHGVVVSSQMFLDALMSALCVRVDDAKCLFALSLLYAMIRNEGQAQHVERILVVVRELSNQEGSSGHRGSLSQVREALSPRHCPSGR